MGYDENTVWENLANFSKNGKSEELKKMKPSDRLLYEIESYGFDMSQLKTVLKQTGNQLTIACAGSGKTTALVFKVIYDIKTGRATRIIEVNGRNIRTPEKIWVCTFLRTGAEELRASMRKWQRRLHCIDTSDAIQFSTLHAEFKRALNSMGVITDLISAADNSKLLKSVVSKYALSNAEGRPLNSENYRDLEGALTYTRNRLDSKRYENEVYSELNIGPTFINSILTEWKAARKEKGLCDFEDLQEILYHECYERNNEDVINFLANRYTFIYIDEFQDTSQIQYELIKIYGSKAKQVMAIGDDDQTIYSWRGSDNSIIRERFSKDFSPTNNMLSINFRCPSTILSAVVPSIKNNKDRFEKKLVSSKDGGELRVGSFTNYSKMVSILGDLVYKDITDGMNVAILCRVNSDGLMPAIMLDKLNKFSFSISGDGMTLDSYIGRIVIGIIKLFTERATPAVKSALNLLTWDTYCINNLIKACKSNKQSIWTINKDDLMYSCPSIADMVLDWRTFREINGDIRALRHVLEYYRTKVFSKDTQFNDVVRTTILSVEALLDYYDYDMVEDFLMELEDINDRLKGRKKLNSAEVRIATVHEFKGKEADSVYIWNDSVNVFPYKASIETLEELEEERRIHYIACTRARKRSTIMFLRGKQGDFVDELDLSGAEVIGDGRSVKGTLSKILEDDMESEKSFRDFSEQALRDESEDNEFWETEEQEYENRYANAEEDFQNRMRSN